ncbi:hypothetical protein MMC11_005111, partial [Xylographa trunciseda]|nr:hypothetical protein [Xylographa trunciseda]
MATAEPRKMQNRGSNEKGEDQETVETGLREELTACMSMVALFQRHSKAFNEKRIKPGPK